MKKKLLGLLGLGAACVACCLPSVAAGLVALGAGGVLSATIGGVSLDVILCIWGPIFLAAVAVAMMWSAYRKRVKGGCECETSCKI